MKKKANANSLMMERLKIQKLFILFLLLCSLNSLLAAPCGDVNSNNIIDIIDALMIAQFSIGLHPQPFDQSAAEVSAAQATGGAVHMARSCSHTPPARDIRRFL